jgi:hypothetical protein
VQVCVQLEDQRAENERADDDGFGESAVMGIIAAKLIPRLQGRFPDRGGRFDLSSKPCVVFPAMHTDVGDLEIFDDGWELIVVAGRFTHGHFSNYDEKLSDGEKAEKIVEDVIAFLEKLFADQIILWGSRHGGGGWRVRNAAQESNFIQPTGAFYVWSGSLEP